MNPNKKPKRKKEKLLNKYLALSGIGVQMGATIYLFSLGGRWLDVHYQTKKEWFTIVSVLVGVFVSVFVLLRQLNRLNRNNK